MSKCMNAAFVTEFGKPPTIGELPVREPGDGQVLIKIEAGDVCHAHDVNAVLEHLRSGQVTGRIVRKMGR